MIGVKIIVKKIVKKAIEKILQLLKYIVRTDNNMIIFSSYTGKKFDDSPKAIFEYLNSDDRFNDFKYIWALGEPQKIKIKNAKIIKINSIKFYYYSIKTRYFISNAEIGEGIDFLGNKTVYINTWHGSAIKKIGLDRHRENKEGIQYINFKRSERCIVDIMTAQSDYDIQVFSRAFQIPKERFLLTGLPRNDELANYKFERKEELRIKLGIEKKKKVILYAPTYRNYNQDRKSNFIEKSSFDINRWESELGNGYIILYRSHYYISKDEITHNDRSFIKDVSDYPYINDLIIVSDILVSDYSSVFFDYSITGKPMICYPYDLDEYKAKVGLYIDLEEEMPNGIVKSESELLNRIKNLDIELEGKETLKFRNKYVEEYGDATKRLVDYIASLTRRN
jgi:CDP-glycerol glycerophosphotransferase